MNIHIYIYIHEQSQNSPTKVKCNRLTWRTKETKNYMYQLRTKLTKAQTGKKKTEAQCQLGNKAMKIKLTNMLRGKERRKRKNRYAKLNRGR